MDNLTKTQRRVKKKLISVKETKKLTENLALHESLRPSFDRYKDGRSNKNVTV